MNGPGRQIPPSVPQSSRRCLSRLPLFHRKPHPQKSGPGGCAGLGGCPRAESPGRASGRRAPGAVLVREHQRRELCFTEVLISGSLTHCSLTPHLDLPPPPQGWGHDGGPIPGCGHHQSVFSHLTVVRALPNCSPEGLTATYPTVMAMGQEEPMGTIAFSPGNVSSSRRRHAKHCCYKLSVGCSRAPSLSTPLGKVRTVFTCEGFPHQQ